MSNLNRTKVRRETTSTMPSALPLGEVAFNSETCELFIGTGTSKKVIKDTELTKAFTTFKTSTETTQKELSSQLDNNINLINSVAMTPVKLNVETDYTQAIQRVVNLNRTCYIAHDMTVSNTITLKANSKIIGTGRSGAKLINTSDNFLFYYTSIEQEQGYDLSIGLTFEDLNIESKNFLRINSRSYNFDKIGALKGGVINNCKISGKYLDINEYTDIKPTLEELQGYGVGIQCTKVFDMSIRDNEIEKFGVGIDFLGCDINLIDNCRLNENARHFHDKRLGTFGSQNKLKNCDVMWNKRYGGVYLDGVAYPTISDNYFECYKDSGTFIHQEGGIGAIISKNRIDDNMRPSIPMIVLKPSYDLLFTENRYTKSSTPSYVSIVSDYYNMFSKNMGTIKNNSKLLDIRTMPLFETKELQENIFNSKNICGIDGELTISYPFEYNAEYNDYVLKSEAKSVAVSLKPLIKSNTNQYRLYQNHYYKTGNWSLSLYKNGVTEKIIDLFIPRNQNYIDFECDNLNELLVSFRGIDCLLEGFRLESL